MHRPLAVMITVVIALCAPSAFAADPTPPKKPPTAQQQRMKDCNAEAKRNGLKGDPRKQFMSNCLKGKRSG